MSLLVKDDLREAHELMGRVLRGGGSLAPEYPLIFEPGFPGRVVTISDGDRIVSACATLERELVLGAERVTVGLIGSVATDESYRRRGLGTKLLAAAERHLSQQGALCSILWADSPAFYEMRGYRPVGWELDYVLSRDLLAGLPDRHGVDGHTVDELQPADAEATHALYLQHPLRTERTLDEHRRLMACPGMRTLVLRRASEVVAYACVGRGADFAGTLHEWAGTPDNVLALARCFLSEEPERLCLISPPGCAGLRAALGARGVTPMDGVLGIGKLLDRQAAVRLLQSKVTRGAIEVVNKAPLRPQVVARGSVGDQPLLDEDLLDLLFPARGAGYTEQAFGAATGICFNGVARHPFLWGLDSV